MSHNFFLTGDLHVGKSTLINRIISNLSFSHITGFRTSRYYKNRRLEGFYIEDIQKEYTEPKDNFIGRCINKNHWVSIPSTFDDYGVKILEDCLKDRSNLVLMDELGFFENDAVKFQNMVSLILDSNIPVLGVLKQAEIPFISNIRNRKDVSVFVVTKDNREEMFSIIMDKIHNVLCQDEKKTSFNFDALNFEKTVKEVFSPIYPVIAKQINDRTQIDNGLCLDIGAGTGHLGIEIARITNLEVNLLDKSQDMLSIADQNIINNDLEGKIKTILGDVHNIPLQDQSVDLVISRGSLYFWEDKKRAFKEIYRVLRPGGIAYVGGGFGTVQLKRKVNIEMQKRDKFWRKNMINRVNKTNIDYYELLEALDIPNVQVINNEANMWIIIRKEINVNSVTVYYG